jgi:pimeloyl-ACP methyl ester carboxylesterase
MFDSAEPKTASLPEVHPKKDSLKSIKHSEEIFTSSSKRNNSSTCLYTQEMFPLEKEHSCVIVFLHGLSSNSSREFPFMLHLVNTLDACVCSLDHIGHGFSDGLPGYVDDYKLCVQDILDYSKHCQKHLKKGMKMFLVGYSMGGMFNLHSLLQGKDLFDASVLICPLISPKDPPNDFVKGVASILNWMAPTYALLPLIDNAT